MLAFLHIYYSDTRHLLGLSLYCEFSLISIVLWHTVRWLTLASQPSVSPPVRTSGRGHVHSEGAFLSGEHFFPCVHILDGLKYVCMVNMIKCLNLKEIHKVFISFTWFYFQHFVSIVLVKFGLNILMRNLRISGMMHWKMMFILLIFIMLFIFRWHRLICMILLELYTLYLHVYCYCNCFTKGHTISWSYCVDLVFFLNIKVSTHIEIQLL